MAHKNSTIVRIHSSLEKEIEDLSKKNKIPKVQASKNIADLIARARVKKVKLKKEIVF